MTTQAAELIDIDYLWYLIDESYEGTIDGDLVTFVHPKRGAFTALHSGRVALLIPGDIHDNRGLPATASLHAFTMAAGEPSSRPSGDLGVVIPFPNKSAPRGPEPT